MSATPGVILVIHGPNLNLLGKREPDVYGATTIDEINSSLERIGAERSCTVETFQSNHEGEIIDFVHDRGWKANGIVFNPGAFTHYSYAIRDAIAAIPAPAIEVHLSNVAAREEFRHHSVIAPVAIGSIAGLGPAGYELALHYLLDQMASDSGSDM
ncbi:MAG: type II 3-dehydroquinate dehydratase [Chloroflexota bacterium]